MMLTVTCYDCGEMYSLRGWIEKEDLRGTQFEEKENMILTIHMQRKFQIGYPMKLAFVTRDLRSLQFMWKKNSLN